MITMMQQTSLFAYAQLQADPVRLSERQRKVYQALQEKPATDKETAAKLHWPINTVTPRRGELVKIGLVEKCGTHWDENTERPEYVWGVLR